MENYYKLYDWVLQRKDLLSSEKILLSLIQALSNKKGVCNASNEFFAQKLNVTQRGIQKLLKSLDEKGYIVREHNSNKHEIIPIEKEFLRK